MDISFIWSLRRRSLIAAVQVSPCRTESITGHILGSLREEKAFAQSLSLAVPPPLPWQHSWRCRYPEAFTNKTQSILHVLFTWFAFLRVHLEVRIPILPSNPLSSGVSARVAVGIQTNLPRPTVPGLAEERVTPSAAGRCTLHGAGRVRTPTSTAQGAGWGKPRAWRKALSGLVRRFGVTAHGSNNKQKRRKAGPTPEAAGRAGGGPARCPVEVPSLIMRSGASSQAGKTRGAQWRL